MQIKTSDSNTTFNILCNIVYPTFNDFIRKSADGTRRKCEDKKLTGRYNSKYGIQ